MKIKDLILDNLNMSIRKFCKEVGLSRTTIDYILNDENKHELNLLTIKKICNYFGADYKDYI